MLIEPGGLNCCRSIPYDPNFQTCCNGIIRRTGGKPILSITALRVSIIRLIYTTWQIAAMTNQTCATYTFRWIVSFIATTLQSHCINPMATFGKWIKWFGSTAWLVTNRVQQHGVL
jgi:hypothetical protein